ncbi:MAG: serine hydrolase domain-containing protein [Pseudomonadota bacterium]
MNIIDQEMEKAITQGVFPAADLLVAKQGQIIYHKQYGNAREGTCFDIASLTKPVCTATLVMLLNAKGLLKLSDTAYQWLAGADKPWHRKITVANLLDHTSGLPSWQPFYRELPLELIGTEEGKKFLINACYQEPLINEPGKETVYSDLGYIFLGEIVEQAGQDKLDNLFVQYIAKPCQLKNTFFITKKGKNQHRFAPTEDCPWRERIIKGEVDDQNAYALGGVAGHAGLFSTALDLHEFTKELVACYQGQSRLISQEVVRNFINFESINQQKRKLGKPESRLFLGGWDTPATQNSAAGHHFSKQSIGHLGFTGCSIWIDLAQGFWVILLSNRVHPSATNEKIKGFRPKIHDVIITEILEK